VVVVASSLEGIDALARLLIQLSSTFLLPIVVHVHGLQGGSINRLTAIKWRLPSRLEVVYARSGEHLRAGFVYLIPPHDPLVFMDVGILETVTNSTTSSVDRLFESAAHCYRSGVIGVVLSGLGTDGTKGLLTIADVDGVRVVQSPYEATFPSMPLSALIGDHVQYAVMLDQMGPLLEDLVANPESVEVVAPEVQAEIARLVLAAGANLTRSLDRSIEDILNVIRQDLAMDITFVTKQAGDDVAISHATPGPDGLRLQGMTHPKHQSLCQRVLEGRLPALMPDIEQLRATHDIPPLPLTVGAYMATPVWLRAGTLYGMLCCLNAAASREMDQRHYRRLQMSAKQIARLVDDAGEK
jgi:hypothetical protein